MADANFIQIHTLHGYAAALLNRDDSGFAKRLSYGGSMRTRISSQCLKRRWRATDDVNALQNIDENSKAVRSREIIVQRIEPELVKCSSEEVAKVVAEQFNMAVYGDKGVDKKSRQPLILGEQEINYLLKEAKKIATENKNDAKAAKTAAEEWRKEVKVNMKAMREACVMPAGVVSALFGRMVTSDTEANIEASIHVAHAFTVHAEEAESDYFTVVDDLKRIDDDSGASHIGETELTSGLFYGYVVVDRKMLIDNLGGAKSTEAAGMAGEIVNRLVKLIATVSPGAKKGSTAPYSYAGWMLIEAGDRQPRSLAEAFCKPCKPIMEDAEKVLAGHIDKLDKHYGVGEERCLMSINDSLVSGSKLLNLTELAKWAGEAVISGKA